VRVSSQRADAIEAAYCRTPAGYDEILEVFVQKRISK